MNLAFALSIREKREKLSVRRPRGIDAAFQPFYLCAVWRERLDRDSTGDLERRERLTRAHFDSADRLDRVSIVERGQTFGARRCKNSFVLSWGLLLGFT